MKKLLALTLAAIMALALLAGCGGGNTPGNSGENGNTPSGTNSPSNNDNNSDANNEGSNAGSGSVYYLNFKPEADDFWQELASAYTAETGVEVKVVTAASGQYETTLMSEIAKSEAPTLFQVNGPEGLPNWKDY